MSVDVERVAQLGHELLVAIGEDPEREGIRDTPMRWARWWREFINHDPGKTAVTFESTTVDQMVVVSDIRVWSLCEHHLLPFWCDVAVAYIARDRVLGLSKFARVAHKHAHRLQVQERLTTGIADEIASLVGHRDVAVLTVGEHLCATMRGVRTPTRMKCSALWGAFRGAEARAEFLSMVRA